MIIPTLIVLILSTSAMSNAHLHSALSCESTAVHCSGHGNCFNDLCYCDEGFTTTDIMNQCDTVDETATGTSASDITVYHSRHLMDTPSLRHLTTDETQYRRLTGDSGFNCTFAPIDCNNNGFCNLERDACICNDGWVTYDPTGTQCNYEQQNRVAPLVLSCIPAVEGFAIQWFITGNIRLGLLHMFTGGIPGIVVIAILYCCGAACCFSGKSDKNTDLKESAFYKMYMCGNCLYVCSCFSWWIYSIVYFATDPTDGNGVPMD